MTEIYPLSLTRQILLALASFIIVGFGQPAWNGWCAVLASAIGYALFWRILFCHSNPWHRFWIATAWFGAVQIIQLSWLGAHPYIYIYALYFLVAFCMGAQFGFVSLFVQPAHLKKFRWLLAISGLWTLMEWARLFILSGFSFNPIGLALTANLYSLQFASLWGIYGLSFWVVLVNLIALKTWNEGLKPGYLAVWTAAALCPYIFGGLHLWTHEEAMEEMAAKPDGLYKAVLVQTSFPIEERMVFRDRHEMLLFVINEWRQILKITKNKLNQKFDLLVLPEFVVPYGTYSFVYPSFVVTKIFREIYGPESLRLLPPHEEPLAMQVNTSEGTVWMVNNAYWVQALANIFNAEVVAGLEDAEDIAGKREYYSSAIHFKPMKPENPDFLVTRYEKRILVPMGEYIPFTFLADLAESYGVTGSFTHGKEAKVIDGKKALGLSICYEETYGHLMRENRQKGAEILVNLTSDAWFPDSRLVRQHFDHARLRTVENGIPLLRACNTGITAGLDSLGRVVGQLGENHDNLETLSDSLLVSVPTYTYKTLYSFVGDTLIVGISVLSLIFAFYIPQRRKSGK